MDLGHAIDLSWKTSKAHISVGIDPGQSGAIGVIWPDKIVQAWSTPTFKVASKSRASGKVTEYNLPAMRAILLPFSKLAKDGYNVTVTLENVSSMPRDGVASAFKFGIGLGLWQGILAGLELFELHKPRPADWKRNMDLSNDKNASRALCVKLYPSLPLPLVKDSDKAEALLLAEFTRRKLAAPPSPVLKKSTGPSKSLFKPRG